MTDLPLDMWVVPLVAALAAGALAVFILLRPWAEAFHRRVALALGFTVARRSGVRGGPVRALGRRLLPAARSVVRVLAHGGDLPGRGCAHRAIVGRGRPRRAAPLVDRARRGPRRGGLRVVGRVRRYRRDGRRRRPGSADAERAPAARRDAARARARAGAARIGLAREPGSLSLPHQVRDPRALRARRIRAVRDVPDTAARRVARPPRGGLGHRDARLGRARGLRPRPHAPGADAGAGVGVVAGALRLVHAARRRALPAGRGSAGRGAAPLGTDAERGRERARCIRGDADARGGRLVARGAGALPRVGGRVTCCARATTTAPSGSR